jgi:hypothetical protein
MGCAGQMRAGWVLGTAVSETGQRWAEGGQLLGVDGRGAGRGDQAEAGGVREHEHEHEGRMGAAHPVFRVASRA